MKLGKLCLLPYFRFQAAQKGTIGLNMYTMWLYPFTDSAEDIEATERVKTFLFGWYVLLY
jgi:beta-glucosidase